MGSSHPNNSIYGESITTIKYLKSLLFINQNDIQNIWNIFNFYNLHKNSLLSLNEFCSFIHCEENLFLQSLFQFFSSNKDNKLTFCEFLLFCYFYLTLKEENLAEYLFIIITNNYKIKITSLTIEEYIFKLFGDVWGNEKNIHHALNVIDHDFNGEVTLNQFKNGLKLNKSLLFLIFSYQTDIREKIISRSYWEERENIGSMLIGSILDIRRELHRLEEEEYKLYGSPDGIERHKLERKMPSQEIIDPTTTTIPVSGHRKNHFKTTEITDHYQQQRSHSSSISSINQNEHKNEHDHEYEHKHQLQHQHHSDSIDESQFQHSTQQKLPEILTPPRPVTSLPSTTHLHHHHHHHDNTNTNNSETKSSSSIRYLPEISNSHLDHDHPISPNQHHILQSFNHQNSTPLSPIPSSKLPSPNRINSSQVGQKLSHSTSSFSTTTTPPVTTQSRLSPDKDSLLQLPSPSSSSSLQQQQQQHGSSQIHSLQRLRISHQNDDKINNSNDYTTFDTDSKFESDIYQRHNSLNTDKEDKKSPSENRPHTVHRHHHHHHHDINESKTESKEDFKHNEKDEKDSNDEK